MSQLIASAFGRTAGLAALASTPLADVTETDDAHLVEVDVPGVKREDITGGDHRQRTDHRRGAQGTRAAPAWPATAPAA